MSTSSQLFAAAIAKHQQGSLADAARLYRSVLVDDPSDASSFNNMALLPGAAQTAAMLLQRAIRLRPDLNEAAQNLRELPAALAASGRHYDYILSLGLNCEVAANIRRVTGQELSFFFDWTQTPYRSVFDLLETDLAGVFQLENLVLHKDGDTVLDQANGLWFHHVFARNQVGKIEMATVTQEWPQHNRVVRYLRDRWLDVTATAERLLFVILTDPAEDHELLPRMTDLLRLLQRKSPAAVVDLLAVSRPGAPPPADQDHLFFRQAAEGTGYDGVHADWDRALDGFRLKPKLSE